MKETLSQPEKRLLKRLLEREHFIESVTDHTPDIIYVIDLASRNFTFLNKRVNEVMGADNQTLDKIHPEDMLPREEHILSCMHLKRGETKDIKLRLKVKSGAWHWFHIRDSAFKTNEEGKTTHVIGVARDIDNDKQQEEALHGILQAHSIKLVVYKAIRNANNTIIDFEFVIVSKEFEEFHGRHDLLGKRVFKEFPHIKENQLPKWSNVVETGQLLRSVDQYPNPFTGEMQTFYVNYEKFNDGLMIVWES